MKILVACEESQRVTEAFRKYGIEAWSCDIKDCSGSFPQYHIKEDAAKVLYWDAWDIVIAHPPCTYLSNAYSRKLDPERYEKGLKAREFFMLFYNYPGKICIENPVAKKIFNLPPYTQIINPYSFGDPYSKRTCLWLKGLKPLIPTCYLCEYEHWTICNRDPAIRSKTFPGVAAAMALQWGHDLIVFGDYRDEYFWRIVS